VYISLPIGEPKSQWIKHAGAKFRAGSLQRTISEAAARTEVSDYI
jgi:hypothetical protein